MKQRNNIWLLIVLISSWNLSVGQNSCENSDFSFGDFTNWTGYTSVYPKETAGANIGNQIAYYFTEGIVPGRHTIITNSTPDPFTCGNVMTIAPGDNASVRLGNGGIGAWGNGVRWQRDYLEYTVSVSDFNALLIYKYAVVLQDPNSDPGIAPHADPIKPRFVVSIKDENDDLIDPVCGVYSVTADESVAGFRNCSQADANAAGGQVNSNGSTIYRAWTTVGVDLRDYIGTDVTLLFETWDCGLGGHFGYAYLSAKCDSMGIDAQSCAANDGVTLTAPDGFSYQWSTGQSTQTIDISNAVAGDTVKVVLTTTTGCSTDLYTVLNPAQIRSVFTAAPKEICQNESVTFQDSSWSMFLLDSVDVPIVNRIWRFGDGTVDASNTLNPTHIYSNYGTYEVTLVVENDFGCIDSSKQTITVKPFPVADFSFEPNCENKTTLFESKALVITGNISTWKWEFGDGDSSTVIDPSHVYSNSGVYDVSLIVKSDFGCVDTVIKSLESWPLPVANFSGQQGCSGDSIFFVNSSTSEMIDTVKSYLWNFGDSSSLSSEVSPAHVYNSHGNYKVQLSIVSDRGCESDTILPVAILQTPVIDFTFQSVCLNAPVGFNNESTPLDSIVLWNWNFGDGTTANTENPTHTYVNSSFFNVTLVGQTINGCTDSVQKTLQVAPNPIVNFKTTDVCLGSTASFKDQSIISSGFITKWTWEFGNDSLADDQNSEHSYLSAGTYDVKLITESDLGCVDSIIKPIIVRSIPKASFEVDSVCLGKSVQFVNTSISGGAGVMTYLWDFGDGSPLKDQVNPQYTYKIDSTFQTKLTVTQNGCQKDTVLPVVIKSVPEASFNYSSVCFGVETSLENDTYTKDSIISWDWYFAEKNLHLYTENVSYESGSAVGFDVLLTVMQANGCRDSIERFLEVTPNPEVDFLTQSKCAGEDMRFTSLATVSKGFVEEWTWDFGDGVQSTLKDPVHAFDTSGVIDVQLIVKTSGNCIDSITMPISVWGQPQVDFSVTNVCLGNASNFTDLTTVGGGAVISKWAWDVGDGSLLKSTKNISHIYPGANTYNVQLSTVTTKGCADTLKKSVTVFPLPLVDFSNSLVCFEDETYFANLSEDSLKIKTWTWDFGDGNSSQLEEPFNLYQTTGEFTVLLNGVDTNGCVSSISKQIVVKPLPQPIFDADHYDGCVPQCMQFSQYSIAPLDTISQWSWTFGNGEVSNEEIPRICYEEPGTFDVSLEITTINGCTNSLQWDSMITIYPMPIAGFTFGPQPTTELNSIITFTDESFGSDFWRWEFGDNNVSNEQSPLNDYYSYGDYKVTQHVTTRFDCADSLSKWVRIEPEFKVVAPNSFTPNGDGINDDFLPGGIGINPDPSKYTFYVFDRWGNLIFETHDINEAWDGKVNTFEFTNTGKIQQIDVYVWKLIVYDITSTQKRHDFIGHVSLLK